ncbi:MAG: SDR family NAD(P)-dependent oxidoreductase, partial [Acidobacteriota bacterium]|nr:SDR family NAD(P)-dependent oxidoreductase [Acidobacteriota bacterium]
MKRALVTGANRGIGLAIAQGLVDRGHEVLLGARDAAAGEKAARRIGAAAVRLDVADPASILRAVDEAGAVDILVNNAGVLGSGGVLDDPEEFAESMGVMVRGPYLLMRHLTPGMVARGYGRVVNVSSGWGAFSEGLGGPGGYGVAKAALNALTVAAARSLPDSVKVNAMCPGWVRTRMGGMGANRSVEEGADTALWLATLGADGPTGG